MKYGRLKIIREEYTDSNHQVYVRCVCDCGNTKIVRRSSLRNGHTQSCGCYSVDKAIETHTKHKGTGTKLYAVYRAMKQRCLNPKCEAFPNYGGRGIAICKSWLGKQGWINFKTWALDNGYKDGMTLERIENDSNYKPSNCRWATRKEQTRNRRTTHFVNYRGKEITLAELRDRYKRKGKLAKNLSLSTIQSRLRYAWELERALTTPIDLRFSHD